MSYDLHGFEGVFILTWCCVMLFVLFITVLTTWAMCKICSKAGYGWALGLLNLVPIGLLVLIFVLGFSTWPIYREMQTLRQQNRIQPIQ
jgi:hypothetical protein